MTDVSAELRLAPARPIGHRPIHRPNFRGFLVDTARRLGLGPRGIRFAAPLLLAAALTACVAPLSTVALRHEQQAARIPVVAPTPAQDRLVALDAYKSSPAIVAVGEEREIAAIETNPTATPTPSAAPAASPAPKPAQRTAPRRRARTVFDPDRLLGMGRDQIVALLGAPGLLRRDPPAELWLYEVQACTAHLFLYQSAPNSDYKVRYFETQVGEPTATMSPSDCFASIVTSGGGGQFGQLR